VHQDVRQLSNWVEQQLGEDATPEERLMLSTGGRQVIDATGQLLGAAQQDPRHGEMTRKLLQQIQLPLAKAAILDPDVLNDKNQPTRQLLDDIDELALLSPTGHDGPLQAVVDELTAAGGNADLQQLTEKIGQLLEQRKGQFSSNVTQVVAGCDIDQQEQKSIMLTREFLLQELGESVAAPVNRMLNLGWASLLVETATQGEAKAKRLQNYKRAIILLVKAFQPQNSSVNLQPDKLQQLVKLLRLGFKSYPLYRIESEELIEQLDEALTRDKRLFRELNRERTPVTPEYLEKLLPLKGLSPDEQTISVYPQWQKQIANIKIGDWITEHHQNNQVRVISLAWHNEDHSRLVFVNGSGIKTLDCSSNELAEGLEQGRFDLIEDGGLPMVERAVNKALKQNYEKLRRESDLDELTGLNNRRAYQRELQRLVTDSEHEQSQHILICMDIDKFSLVNDICGDKGGDEMLANIANICRSYLTRPGMLARTGSDEFSILIEHCTPNEGFRIAENQRQAIENYRFSWGGKEASVTASIGMTEITPNGRQADKVSQAARTACNQAKKDGHNCVRRYQPDKEEFKQQRRMVKSIPLIEQALSENRLELHAQLISPVFIGDGLIEHHEILLRPLDENGEPTSPVEFIQAAEQYGRMLAVDRWVVKSFMRWAENAVKEHGAENMGAFSINLSRQSLMDENFSQFLLEQLENSPIPPKQIAFEITETAMVNQTSRTKKVMDAVHNLGCTFFLDDFGSGYASYSYLKNFPVDVVKIDGIFVKDVHQDETSRAMVKSITEVAHNMNKLVVAEFVESEGILVALRELEVDYAQGYGIGHPSPLQTLTL
jgi:diguanylate cyclase (GGDEF)-like protein